MKASPSILFTTLLSLSLIPACGTDERNDQPDADPSDPDAEIVPPDAGDPDADTTPVTDPAPIRVRLSATGADGFNAVTFAPDGSFFAAGYTAATATDRAMAVAKFTPAGTLDTSFGTLGLVAVNVAVGGGSAEAARSVVVQSTGKIVVAGIIEHDVTAVAPASSDRDGALFRLNGNGTLDASFDSDGIVILDFNTGVLVPGTTPGWAGADDLRSVSVDATDRLIVHGGQLTPANAGTPSRTDADWVLARLTPDGAYDTTFNGTGRFVFDILQGGASVRSAAILPDGSLLGTGYSNTTAFNSTQPVLYKVSAAGALETAWGTDGFFHELVLGYVAEVYEVAMQGDKLVTQGYGRDTSTATNDWLSLRINADGTLDTSWGDGGQVRTDWHGFGDNGRALTALSGGRILFVGSGQTADGLGDAKLLMLEGDGDPDADFSSDGVLSYDFGGTADAFWGVAPSPDGSFAVAVGTRGVGSTQTAEANDDAMILVIRLE